MTRPRDPNRSRSSLDMIAPLCRESDPSLGRSACARIWHETGLLVVNPKHFSWVGERKAMELGRELYGERKA